MYFAFTNCNIYNIILYNSVRKRSSLPGTFITDYKLYSCCWKSFLKMSFENIDIKFFLYLITSGVIVVTSGAILRLSLIGFEESGPKPFPKVNT